MSLWIPSMPRIWQRSPLASLATMRVSIIIPSSVVLSNLIQNMPASYSFFASTIIFFFFKPHPEYFWVPLVVLVCVYFILPTLTAYLPSAFFLLLLACESVRCFTFSRSPCCPDVQRCVASFYDRSTALRVWPLHRFHHWGVPWLLQWLPTGTATSYSTSQDNSLVY